MKIQHSYNMKYVYKYILPQLEYTHIINSAFILIQYNYIIYLIL